MLLIYTIVFVLAVILYYLKQLFIASGLMIALAIFLYTLEYKKSGRLINICGLFVLGFVGGFGVSLLKLSNLSAEYSIKTIVTVYVSFFSLYLGSYFARRNKKSLAEVIGSLKMRFEVQQSIQEKFILFMFLLTFISFAIEVYILRFIPLFTIATPHAYSTFHVFLLHYITSLYVLIPSFAIVNYYISSDKKRSKYIIIISFIYVVIMAVLLVSRAQLIMSIVISIFVILTYRKDLFKNLIANKRILLFVIVSIVSFILIYVFITIHRAHDVKYLNGIFEMKDEKTPIYITQPYMYIAHNFENLNYMINNIFRWGFGRRMLTPFFTLTLIKKLFPLVADAPTYVIKEELTAKTLIYDFYYDFGIIGVMVMCILLGYIGKILEEYVYDRIENNSYYKNNYIVVLYSIFCYYMLFSFFQTYFSLTETWVIFIVISIFCIFVPIIREE